MRKTIVIQLFLSFPSSDTRIATRISECVADISTWMTAHHLKLNLDKTKLLFILGKDCPHMDLLQRFSIGEARETRRKKTY